jgi:hypothetical protein
MGSGVRRKGSWIGVYGDEDPSCRVPVLCSTDDKFETACPYGFKQSQSLHVELKTLALLPPHSRSPSCLRVPEREHKTWDS